MSGLGQGRPFVDAAQHVVQAAAVGTRVMHVVRGDDGNAGFVRERAERVAKEVVVCVEVVLELDIQPVAEDLAQASEMAPRRIGLAGTCGLRQDTARASGEARDALGMLAHEVEGEAGRLLFAGELTAADEPAQARPTGVVLRQEHEVVAVDELELRAEHGVKAALLSVVPEADRAIETVGVGERETLEAKLEGAVDEIFGMRGAVEERVIAMRVKLGILRGMPLNAKTIAFIGGGTMAEAMIRGLVQQGLIDPSAILVTGPRPARRDELAKAFGVRGVGSNLDAAKMSDVVVLSVKPQVLPVVLRELRGGIRKDALVISIVAGVALRTVTDGLGHEIAVRSMPNTPAQVGKGITVWCATQAADDAHRAQARAILGALGEEVFVDDEDLVDMATAVSGTGPTYVFLLMEALVDAAVHLGFSRRVAEQLVLSTVEGSAVFARNSGKHLAELRNQVTSPGGTSAAAIYQLEKGSLRTVLSKAVYAAFQRTRELGEMAEKK